MPLELLLFSATITAIMMLSWALFTLSEIHKELSSIRQILLNRMPRNGAELPIEPPTTEVRLKSERLAAQS
jgi:hypothetical protein